MARIHAPSAAAVAGHPAHPSLSQFPTVCFTLTLFTDIAYWRTENLMWQNFSSWLLLAGLVFGALAVLTGAIDFVLRPSVRHLGTAWLHAVGSLVVLILALFNSLVHAADGWTGVVPWGLALSVATIVVMVVSDWLGRALVYRHSVGVRDHA